MSSLRVRLTNNYFLRAGFFVGIALAAYACQLFLSVRVPYEFWGFSLLVFEASVFWASALHAKAPGLSGQERASRVLMFAAFTAYLMGDAYWVTCLSLGGPRPEQDAFCYATRLAFSLFLMAGLAVQLRILASNKRAVILSSALLIAASFVLVFWELGYSNLWSLPSLSPADRLRVFGTGLVNVSVLSMAATVAIFGLKQGYAFIRRKALSVGAILLMVGELSSDAMLATGAYYEGSVADVTAMGGLLLAGFGFSSDKPRTAGQQSYFHWMFPFVDRLPSLFAFTSLLLTLGSDLVTGQTVDPSALAMCIAVIVLISIRQSVVAVSDQFARNQELEEIRESLEFDVLKKTAQLREMLELSRSVIETLDIPEILCRSLDHARKVVRCKSGIARFFDSDGLGDLREEAVWVEGQPVSLSMECDVRSKPDFQISKPDPRTFGKAGAFYVISVDIFIQERQVGWIALGRADLPFEVGEADLLSGIGQIATSALANARTYLLAKDAGQRDPTTNLLNHRAIHEKLVLDLERARKNRVPLSLIMVDVDNFQRFNGTYGHTNGDELLRLVAGALSQVAPAGALVGRFGADEFVIGLLGFTADAALAVASELAVNLENKSVQPAGNSHPIPVNVTCGIATYPEDCDTYEDLLLTAEQNLEQARLIGHEVALTSEIHRVGRLMRTDSSFEVLDMLVTAVDNKDSYTRKHSEQVAEFATWICEALGMDGENTRVVQQAALLHDVGKIGVPAEILAKPGRLTDDEASAVNRHPVLGANLVAAFKDMEAILPGVRHHHERWDGLGYPGGLAGNGIPLIARILCIADTFSAMVTDRAYRKALNWDIALEEVKSHLGTQFDPELGRLFIKAAERKLSTLLPKSRRAA